MVGDKSRLMGKVPMIPVPYLIETPRRDACRPALGRGGDFGVRYNFSELLAVADRRPDRRYLDNPGLYIDFTTEATEASPFKRLTGYFGGNPPEPVTPETTKPTPEPCSCLVALRLGIFFVLYPAVISYLWFYYIPTRSIPK